MKRRLNWILAPVGVVVVVCLPSIAEKAAPRKVDGEQIYKQYCASCHTGGGNSVKPSRPVAGSKQLATMATFKAYLSAPPGHMPYYRSIVADPQVLDALYHYCKKLTKPTKQALGRRIPSG